MHVGLIPDGNRRYMAEQGIRNLLSSYDMGINKFYDFLKWCQDLGADEVTIYALSLENLKSRGSSEINTLMKVFKKHAEKGVRDDTLRERGARVRVCGDMQYLIDNSPDEKLAKEMVESLKNLEESSRDHGDFTLNLAIAYGGRQEIMHAVKELVDAGEDITEEAIKKHLWVRSEPDIIIRTSEERLSNFLLWQSAYSEIYFLPKLWQEFEREDLEKIMGDFKSKERRYGR